MTTAAEGILTSLQQVRLVNNERVPSIGSIKLTRMWPEVTQVDLPALLAYLNANPTVVAPRIENQTFAGTYFGGKAYYDWTAPDPATPEGRGSKLNLFQDLFLADITGPTATVEDSCRYTVTAYTIYYSATPPVLPDHEVGVVYQMSNPVIDPQSGLYTTTITRREQHYQTTGEFTAEQSGQSKTKRTRQTGVSTQTIPSIEYADLADGTAATQDRQVNENCTKDVTTDVETGRNQHHESAQVLASQTTVTEVDTLVAPGDEPDFPPTPAAGEAVSLNIEQSSKYKNRSQVTQTTETVANQTATRKEVQAGQTTSVETNTAVDNGSLPANPPTPGTGEAKTLVITPDPKFAGVSRTEEITEEIINQQRKQNEVLASQTTTTTVDTAVANGSLPAYPPTPGTGEAKTLVITPDPKFAGVNQVAATTEVVTNQTATRKEVQAGQTTSVVTKTAVDNGSLPANPPTPGTGEAKTLVITPDPKFAGVSRTEEITEEIINQQRKQNEVLASQTTTTTVDTAVANGSLPAYPPTPGTGEAKTLVITPDPKFAGVNQVAATTEVVTNQTATRKEVQAGQTTSVVTKTAVDNGSLPANPPTPGTGEAKTLVITPDPKFAGVSRTEEITEEIINQQRKQNEVLASQTTTTTVDTAVANGSLPAYPPTPGTGEAKTLVITPDPKFAGVNQVAATTEVVTNQTATRKEVQAGQTTSVVTKTAVDNGSLPANPPTPGTGEAKTLVITPDPKFAGVSRTEEITEEIINQQRKQNEVLASQTTTTTVDTAVANSSLPAYPPTPGTGEAKTLVITPDPKFAGVNQVAATTEVVTNQTATRKEVQAGQTTSVVTKTAVDNGSLPATPPTPDDGQAKTLVITPDPKFAGVSRTEEITEEAVDQTIRQAADFPDRTIDATTHTSVASGDLPDDPPVAGDGENKRIEIVEDPKFKNRFRYTEETQTAGKLEMAAKTYTDYDGDHDRYEADNLTETELDAALAALPASVRVNAIFGPSRQFKSRFSLTYTTNEVEWGAANNAAYDAIGEFIIPFTNDDQSKEYCAVVLFTRSKTVAQNYVLGTDATKTYGETADVNAATDGEKDAWTTSVIVAGAGAYATGLQRNRGSDRWIATRVQLRTS